MKKLVLGALFAAAASSTGCVASTDAVVSAQWSFERVDGTVAGQCPAGFPTVGIYAAPWDPFDDTLGAAVVDLFDCSDMQGTTAPLDGIFRVWVQIEDDRGGIYAKSKSVVVDTLDGDALIDFPILSDGGYFYLTWDLVDAVTQAPLTCSEAGLSRSGGAVETVATMSTPESGRVDKFDCEDGFGTTSPLRAGSYSVYVDAAEDGAGALGEPVQILNKVITAPSGLTDLGHVLIPID